MLLLCASWSNQPLFRANQAVPPARPAVRDAVAPPRQRGPRPEIPISIELCTDRAQLVTFLRAVDRNLSDALTVVREEREDPGAKPKLQSARGAIC